MSGTPFFRSGLVRCLFIFFMHLLFGCSDGLKRNKSHATVSLFSIRKGAALAATYCQSCHALPDPSLLNAGSWEKGVLPNMGPRLGIFTHQFRQYPSAKYDPALPHDFYPTKPVLSSEQWQHIIDYYQATSPDSLPAQQRKQPIVMNLQLFEAQLSPLTYNNARTSFVKINADAVHALTISDAGTQKTYFLNKTLQLMDSVHTSGPIVDMELFQNTMMACNIGMLNPTNGTFGKATTLHQHATNGWQEDTTILFSGLKRPVQISSTDLNNDGRTDFLICEFGYLTGSLCWMESKSNGTYQRHVLRPLPGAVKAYFQDYNHDGLMDIWVLFAQGDEGIFLYTNKGNGNFDEKEVLRFPPAYGSSYFELTDFNNDGYSDIVYTCGDNADYSPVLKPYHGVYVFLNDKTNNFKQQFFFPMHGCYKAVARDFDKDGDLDLAVIAFFADYARQPEEGFVYLENTGNYRFQPRSLEAAKQGRWLTMDAGNFLFPDSTARILQ